MSIPPNLEKHKDQRGDGSWETYWRAGFVAEGQPPVIVETYCRREAEALKTAEVAANEHFEALKDVGVMVEVKAFIQRWKTRTQGNLEEYEAAVNSTRMVLRPDDYTRANVTEAIKRGREKRRDTSKRLEGVKIQ